VRHLLPMQDTTPNQTKPTQHTIQYTMKDLVQNYEQRSSPHRGQKGKMETE